MALMLGAAGGVAGAIVIALCRKAGGTMMRMFSSQAQSQPLPPDSGKGV